MLDLITKNKKFFFFNKYIYIFISFVALRLLAAASNNIFSLPLTNYRFVFIKKSCGGGGEGAVSSSPPCSKPKNIYIGYCRGRIKYILFKADPVGGPGKNA
jgi:hypothetical protein